MKPALGRLAAGWMWLSAPALADDTGWPQYGGDQGGQRHSTATQITPANVGQLHQAWSYSTGDATRHAQALKGSSFENTPILDEAKLFVCSAFQEVSALDPGTGKEIWRFDPHVPDDPKLSLSQLLISAAAWPIGKVADGKGRIFLAANNRRLYALDAATGVPIQSFGDHGAAVIYDGMLHRETEMEFTSGPSSAMALS